MEECQICGLVNNGFDLYNPIRQIGEIVICYECAREKLPEKWFREGIKLKIKIQEGIYEF